MMTYINIWFLFYVQVGSLLVGYKKERQNQISGDVEPKNKYTGWDNIGVGERNIRYNPETTVEGDMYISFFLHMSNVTW